MGPVTPGGARASLYPGLLSCCPFRIPVRLRLFELVFGPSFNSRSLTCGAAIDQPAKALDDKPSTAIRPRQFNRRGTPLTATKAPEDWSTPRPGGDLKPPSAVQKRKNLFFSLAKTAHKNHITTRSRPELRTPTKTRINNMPKRRNKWKN